MEKMTTVEKLLSLSRCGFKPGFTTSLLVSTVILLSAACGDKTDSLKIRLGGFCTEDLSEAALIRALVINSNFQTIYTATYATQGSSADMGQTFDMDERLRFELEALTEGEVVLGRGSSRWTELKGGGIDMCVFLGPLDAFVLASDCQCNEVRLPFNLVGHTATTLPDGRVLITGGATVDDSGGILDVSQSVFIYDPNTTKLRQLASGMRIRRAYHTATLLKADNSAAHQQYVLISGGLTLINQVEIQSSVMAEIFDPVSETFSVRLLQMNHARFGHSATLLTSGDVLIAGGAEMASNQTLDPERPPLLDELSLERIHPDADYFVFDPAQVISSTFLDRVIPMAQARIYHAAARGEGSRVLVSGGEDGVSVVHRTTEIFESGSRTFTTGAQMVLPRSRHTATNLQGNSILLAGGLTSFRNPATATGRVEVFQLSVSGSGVTEERPESVLVTPRFSHITLDLVTGDRALVMGGYSVHGYTSDSVEIVFPGSATHTSSPLTSERVGHSAARLPGGSVLVVGGMSVPSLGGVSPKDTLEIFTPLRDTD